MSPSCYADVVLPVPLHQAFTYLLPEGMAAAAGVRVCAPWGSRKLIGVVTALRTEPPPGVKASQIKALSGVIDAEPLLDAAMLQLVRWAAAYYQAPVGELMRAALPPGPVRGDGAAPAPRTRRIYRLVAQLDEVRLTPAQRQLIAVLEAAGGEADAAWLRPRASASALQTLLRRGRLAVEEGAAPPPAPAWQPRPRIATLNSSQALALAAIEGGDNPAGDGDAAVNSKPVLLHGVTGSGKTAVYIAAIEAALARGQAALMLVPEIGLT
ncbi:MAG TPA: DEAD/DEAH box helicase family protein, partial [Terriglobales bacterium]|nr:DEAD/DEAH box helicase family protein [Terriglobales bacterium]